MTTHSSQTPLPYCQWSWVVCVDRWSIIDGCTSNWIYTARQVCHFYHISQFISDIRHVTELSSEAWIVPNWSEHIAWKGTSSHQFSCVHSPVIKTSQHNIPRLQHSQLFHCWHLSLSLSMTQVREYHVIDSLSHHGTCVMQHLIT